MKNEEPEFLLELEGLEHCLQDSESGEQFVVRVDQCLKIARRTLVAILGPSGCGKTTLLTILGLLRSPNNSNKLKHFVIRVPDSGNKWVEYDLKSIWDSKKTGLVEKLRRQNIGFALQSGELLSALTVRENISIPLKLNGISQKQSNERVNELLESFGLAKKDTPNDNNKLQNLGSQRINRLSGGEYQRVVIARAIAHQPTLVFIDEPTSALNRELAHDALRQLRQLQCGPNSNGAVVMITHDEELAKTFADVIVRMEPSKTEALGELVEVHDNNPSIEESDSNKDEISILSNIDSGGIE